MAVRGELESVGNEETGYRLKAKRQEHAKQRRGVRCDEQRVSYMVEYGRRVSRTELSPNELFVV